MVSMVKCREDAVALRLTLSRHAARSGHDVGDAFLFSTVSCRFGEGSRKERPTQQREGPAPHATCLPLASD